MRPIVRSVTASVLAIIASFIRTLLDWAMNIPPGGDSLATTEQCETTSSLVIYFAKSAPPQIHPHECVQFIDYLLKRFIIRQSGGNRQKWAVASASSFSRPFPG